MFNLPLNERAFVVVEQPINDYEPSYQELIGSIARNVRRTARRAKMECEVVTVRSNKFGTRHFVPVPEAELSH